MSEERINTGRRRGGPRGMTGEKAKDFRGSIIRLAIYLKPYRLKLVIMMICAMAGTIFTIVGPRVLGRATTELFAGIMAKIQGTGSIDFAKIREICDEVGCYMMVDMAHIAGLVAAKKHISPVPYADIVTSTTHKTLRGPRGGLILTNNPDLIKKINSAVFPFYQGGPLEHVIAAKAACFKEANTPEFVEYVSSLMENTKVCSQTLKELGALATDTDNHLFLLNTLDSFGITGLEAQKRLESIGVTTNKNMIPGDKLSPKETSGLRIGFAAVTTRGCTKEDAIEIAKLIYNYLGNKVSDEYAISKVKELTSKWKKIEEI